MPSILAGSADAARYDRSYLYASDFDDGLVQKFPVGPLGSLGSHVDFPASAQAAALVISPDATALFAGSIGPDTIDSYAIGPDGDLTSHVATTPAFAVDLAITPSGSFLYSVKSDAGSANSRAFQGYAVNGSALTELSPTYLLPLGQVANAIAISPDGNSLYVAAADTATSAVGSIYRYAIDTMTGALSEPTLEVTGLTASTPNLGLSPDGKSLYAPAPGADLVYQFDVTPSSGRLQAKEPPSVVTEAGPYSVTVTPNGRFAYVNGLFDVGGYAIDAETGELTPIGTQPTQFFGRFGAVSPDSRLLYVNAYPVHQFSIDPATGVLAPLGPSVPDFKFHVGLAFTPDQGPVASFTSTAAPAGSPSTFDASGSTDSDGTVATYLWDFHDGPPVSGGPTITHTFASAGPHDVDLIVEDEMGCSTARTYTGHMVHCNGGSAAAQRQTVVIEAVEPPAPLPTPAPSPTPAPPNLVAGTPLVPPLPCVADGTPSNRFSVSARAKRRSGTIVLTAKLPGCGTLQLLGTHHRPSTAARAQLTPGNRRFAWGGRTVTTRREGSHTLVVALKPNRRGWALIARHRSRGWPLHIRVSAAYRPDGGAERRHVVVVRIPMREVSASGGR